jgi:hypothetical protein
MAQNGGCNLINQTLTVVGLVTDIDIYVYTDDKESDGLGCVQCDSVSVPSSIFNKCKAKLCIRLFFRLRYIQSQPSVTILIFGK